MARARAKSSGQPAVAPAAERQLHSGAVLEQEVFLAILKTGDLLQGELAEMLKPSGLSPTQYNALRILRGAGDDGLPCGQVAARMLTHDPDMTRLFDRLEARSLIRRFRDETDRRVVRAQIVAEGLRALAELDQPTLDLHRRQLGHFRKSELIALQNLLRAARERTG